MRTTFNGPKTVVCVTILLSFTPAFAETPSTQDSILGQRVAEMMQVGYARGPKALNETQSQYESLSKVLKNDPRIDYAHGLILLRLMKNNDARDRFLVATKRPGTPYWPAWEALIWTHFVGKDYGTGYEQLLNFAKLVQTSNEVNVDARDDAIDWIGRVMAALELTLDSNKSREAWLRVEKKLTDLLGEDATDDYYRGKEDVLARHSLLEDDIRESREKAKKQQDEQLEKKQTRIQKSLEAVKQKKENLKKSAEEMKELLAEQSAAYQKQLARLEKDYGFFERRSAVLVTTMAALDQEAAILQQRKRNANNNQASGIDQAITQLQNQRFVCSTEFMRTTAAADEISVNAQKLNLERAAFVEQYQKATGDIVEADAGAEKWKERTLIQAKALKKTKATAKPPVPVAKIQASKTFRTYVDLDLYAERNKVLASFDATPLEK